MFAFLKGTLYRSLRRLGRMNFPAGIARSFGMAGLRLGPVRSISPIKSLPPESGLTDIITLRKGGEWKRPPAIIYGGSEPENFNSALRGDHPDFVLGAFDGSSVLTSEGWLLSRLRRKKASGDPMALAPRHRVCGRVHSCLPALVSG
jgi:hypothetical protein